MFDLTSKSQAIVTALEAEADLGTVAYIEDDDESGRFPCTFPAAFVCLEKILPGAKKKGITIVSDVTWTIIIRSKKLIGPDGCLPSIDLIIDALVGFRAGTDAAPLSLLAVEYFDKQAESVSYKIQFGSTAAGLNKNTPCGATT